MAPPGKFIYYAHYCPETNRWFVCREGIDNNLCECFPWHGLPAETVAVLIAGCLNLWHMWNGME